MLYFANQIIINLQNTRLSTKRYKVGLHGMISLEMKIQKKKMLITIKVNQQYIMKDGLNVRISFHIGDYLNLVHHIDEIAHCLEIEDHVRVGQFLESEGEVGQVQEIGGDLKITINIDLDLGQVVETGIKTEIEIEIEENHIVVDLDLFLEIGKGLITEADHVQEVTTDIEVDLIQGRDLRIVGGNFFILPNFWLQKKIISIFSLLNKVNQLIIIY